jgi:hypothetical protein
MSRSKTQVSIRMRIEDRASLQAHADRERRTLGNFCENLLTWALRKLEKAGSSEKLLERKISDSKKRKRWLPPPLNRRANAVLKEMP